jgi:hypothetical protein
VWIERDVPGTVEKLTGALDSKSLEPGLARRAVVG